MRAALEKRTAFIVTLFINPKQFNSAADLAACPHGGRRSVQRSAVERSRVLKIDVKSADAAEAVGKGDGGLGMSAVQDGEGGMTSHQVFSNPVKFLQADAWWLSLKKPLFSCGRLKGSDRSVLAAVSGQALLNHSDCFKSGRLAHDWPWLLKRCLSVGYRRDHHRFVIQVDCNRNERRHFYRSPGLKVAKREGTAVVA